MCQTEINVVLSFALIYGSWQIMVAQVTVVGAGPCGLRTAIEAQLLGARVTVIEKRTSFTR